MKFLCESPAQFLPRLCAVLIRFPRGAGGPVQAVGTCALWSGCRIVSGSSRRPRRAGAPDRSCASKLFKLLLVPHILPFFRLAAIIFFFCKIFCKQPQKKKKSYYKKGERTLALRSGNHRHQPPVSPPRHMLLT